MKRVVVIILGMVLTISIWAAKFYPAVVTYKDGKQLNGMAKMPSDFFDKKIAYKSSENSDVEKLESEKIKNITYTVDDTTKVEYDRMCALRGKKLDKLNDEMWMVAMIRGKATLYYYDIVFSYTNANGYHSSTDRYFGCIRENEKGTTLLIWVIGGISVNTNALFKSRAPIYFSDNPELAEKIKDKSYKWKSIEEVVTEYNKSYPSK